MKIVELIISISTLFIPIIIFIFQRKMDKQNLILNQYKIQEEEERKQRNKSAKISGSIIKENNRGDRKLIISNTGLAPARNINVTDIRKFKGILQTGGLVFPYSLLNPGEKIEIPFMISLSSPDKINIKCRWDDENKQNNLYEQSLQL